MTTRPKEPAQVVHMDVDHDEVSRLEAEAAKLQAASLTPQPLDDPVEEVGPTDESTLGSTVPQRDEVIVDSVAMDYVPVAMQEQPDDQSEYRTVRLGVDIEPFYYTPDVLMEFKAGNRYRVHREIANMLQRKGALI